MKKLKKKICFLTFLCYYLIACGGGNDSLSPDTGDGGTPTFSAPKVSNVTYNSAALAVKVGNYTGYTMAGFCFDMVAMPSIYSSSIKATIGSDDSLKVTLSTLQPNTTYYARAFVQTKMGQVYSLELSFTTTSQSVSQQLDDYVAPSYVDHYVNIASWAQRGQWNLANVHDPSVMKADDGYYYMYQTDASYGNAHNGNGHFHARRSKNLVDWQYLGATMESTPDWVLDSVNNIRTRLNLPIITNPQYGYWAPVVRKISIGKYRMYYSLVIDNFIGNGLSASIPANFDETWTERAFIGMMETSDPASNKWEDKGMVICSSSDRGTNWSRSSLTNWNAYFKWNAIDPSYIITENGDHWLIYGSWHSGISSVQIDPSTGKSLHTLGNSWGTESEISNYGKLLATRQMDNRWQASEGPEIVYRDGYYYLFLAYDELSVAYNTRVVRATDINGPYYGIDGTNVTDNGGNALPIVTHPYKFRNDYGWVGISHCAIFDDGNDNWFYASQGRLPAGAYNNDYANAIMLGQVRAIRWTKSGWPLVMPERYGAVPQVPITESELVGNWEHIDLSYKYAVQKESSVMTLAADHTITLGTWNGGSWSFDEDSQILTANGVELYLMRECDWEASPRTHTIVYAGCTNSKTYWGKKSK